MPKTQPGASRAATWLSFGLQFGLRQIQALINTKKSNKRESSEEVGGRVIHVYESRQIFSTRFGASTGPLAKGKWYLLIQKCTLGGPLFFHVKIDAAFFIQIQTQEKSFI